MGDGKLKMSDPDMDDVFVILSQYQDGAIYVANYADTPSCFLAPLREVSAFEGGSSMQIQGHSP